jgi:hypothetical protein
MVALVAVTADAVGWPGAAGPAMGPLGWRTSVVSEYAGSVTVDAGPLVEVIAVAPSANVYTCAVDVRRVAGVPERHRTGVGRVLVDEQHREVAVGRRAACARTSGSLLLARISWSPGRTNSDVIVMAW